ncbi:hypothetical protein B0T19DRAFT_412683, partial [Cercophora scortea]
MSTVIVYFDYRGGEGEKGFFGRVGGARMIWNIRCFFYLVLGAFFWFVLVCFTWVGSMAFGQKAWDWGRERLFSSHLSSADGSWVVGRGVSASYYGVGAGRGWMVIIACICVQYGLWLRPRATSSRV